MTIKELNDKILDITKNIKATNDKALKDKFINELKALRNSVTFENIEDWKEEYSLNHSLNEKAWYSLTTGGDKTVEQYNASYQLYYGTKGRINQIKKQHEQNLEILDATIESLSNPVKAKK